MKENLNKIAHNNEISLKNWRTHPYNRIAFSTVDKIIPYEVIHKGTKEISFHSKIKDISSFEFLNKYNEKQTIINFFEKNLTDSFQIFKKGNKILKSSNNSNLKTVKIIGNFHGTLSYERQRKVIKKFGWSFRLAGFDALNYCLLAEGTVDAVIEANLKPYDILPLIPIIKNSGAIVTNWKNEPAEIGGNIIASSNKALHNKILRLLKPFTKK